MQHEIAKWHKNGFVVYYQPLLKIVHLPINPLDEAPQAIVLSSVNAAESLKNSDWDRHIPVYGVGIATVTAAKLAGFKNCFSPNSAIYPSALNLIDWIKQNLQPSSGLIVHGSGEILRHNIVAILKNFGFSTLRIILYKTQTTSIFAHEIEQALKSGMIQKVTISSQQALETFTNLCQKSGIDFRNIKPIIPSAYLQNIALNCGFSK